MKGLSFITDETNHKRYVQMDLVKIFTQNTLLSMRTTKNSFAALCLLQALLFSNLSYAQSCTISTFSGVGIAGFYGDGGPASTAEMGTVRGLTIDNANNLYVADFSNERIRKISITTGIITTIAGTGAGAPRGGAYSGDGGLATDANLSGPSDVALDDSGNVYFSDFDNNRIRKISATTGIITTIAGCGLLGYGGDGLNATAALLNGPWGIAFDASGDLYIADMYNSRVRKIHMPTGIISTFAGITGMGYSGDGGPATLATLNLPSSLVFDKYGNLCICDAGNYTVRVVNALTGIITTVAGTGTAGYSGAGGPATAAELYEPIAITFDTSNNLYIADAYQSNRIRMVSAVTGIITTIAGNGTAGYDGDGGNATAAEMDGPDGLVFDTQGNLYISDKWNNVVRKLNSVFALSLSGTEGAVNNTAVYPNPVTDELTLSSPNNITKVEIYNLLGQCVFFGNYQANKVMIDMRDVQAGAYVVKVNGQDYYQVVKE